ncbi:unnamed protein product [Parnassius apollo]|uniref:glycogenin glucosyltransferase n=1 Tax=Parnassius apollo TaxID=110799 RepID=A0A8S3WTR6_PARAO|nr:unnamed protein product [Parnassius apollo]
MTSRAWVTLATNDSYSLGALVLAHSLRRAGSAYPAVVLITPSVTDPMRDRLNAVFANVVTVDVLDSGDAAHLALLQRPDLGITFTKIHCWNLTQYEKCVFLDADTLVVQNCDELFDREELSAAPDVGWPDCFNSGVFVFRPSAETFSSLITFAQERGSFDGGDQGLLNSYFSDWAHGDINKHLPFLYNVTSAAFYSYLPAFKQFGQNLKIIHFIGAAKPWLQHFNWESRSVDAPEHLRELLQLWWDLFVSQVHTQLDPSMSGVAGNLARVSPDAVGTQQEAIDELTRRQGWEAGSIDYMGADSFANIWAKISQTLSQAPASVQKLPTPPPEEHPSAKETNDQPKAVETDAVLLTTDESQKTIRSDISEQPKETKDDSGIEKTPAESPAAVEASIPVDRPVTSGITAASESTVSLEATKQAPAEAAPLNIAAPITESSSSGAPAEVKTASIDVKAGAPISKETSTVPEDSQVEIPVPVVEAVLAEAVASTDSANPTSEIPKPVIEAFSDVESLKETKSETTPVVPASEKTVEPPKEKSDKSVKPPEPEVLKQDPKSVLAESVQVVSSAADPKLPAVAAQAPPSPAVAESTKTDDEPSQPEDIPSLLLNLPRRQRKRRGFDRKAEERRRPVGKLHLSPPVTADPLPTPDSELEDAATLAQSIIASELRTPTVKSPSPQTPASPAQPKQEKRLSVEEPKVQTPPIGSVSLSQIGVKSAKEKSTIAAQIESSISDKPMPASPTTTDPKASVEAPKKKVVKKVLKKDSATSGDAPVPPPRKKEKKPKE